MRDRKDKDLRWLTKRSVDVHPVAARSAGVFLLSVVGIMFGFYRNLFLLIAAGLFLGVIAAFLMFLFGMGVGFLKRLLFLLISVACFWGFIYAMPDVPYALHHDYCFVEGEPTNIESITNKWGDTVGATVSLYNTSKTFDLYGWDPNELYGRWIEIHYLPHTGFLINAHVLSYQESWKKSGLFKE